MKLSLKEWCIKNHKEYLINEWDAEKNRKELGLEIENCTPFSGKKVWWKCTNGGHGWASTVGNRTGSNLNQCPVCAGQKILVGFNDFKTRAIENNMEYLVEEWDAERNIRELELRIEDVSFKATRKVWWKCVEHGHSWYALISNRTSGFNYMCPVCSGRKVVTGFNDLATLFPDLVKNEWDYEKNTIDPAKISSKIKDKAHWKCMKHGHTWTASIASRTREKNPSGCPICSNRQVLVGFNDLKAWAIDNNKEHLIKEWDEEKNRKKLNLGIEDIVFGSNKNIWWKCEAHGHSWITKPSRRIVGISDCPVCYGSEVLEGFNDLETWCVENNKEYLISEWDKEKNEKELGIKMKDFSFGSEQKAWWKCTAHEHSWIAAINSRTNGSGCPTCSNYGTSYPEQFLYLGLKQKFNRVSNRKKINGLEYDIYIKDLNLLIEYDGIYWHRIINNKIDKEQEKENYALNNGYGFLRIIEADVVDVKKKDNSIITRMTYNEESLKLTFEAIIGYINDIYSLKIKNELARNTYEDAKLRTLSKECEESIVKTHPGVVEAWNYERNKIKPSQLTHGSNQKVWWECKECGHEWKAMVCNKVRSFNIDPIIAGCPQCRNDSAKKVYAYRRDKRLTKTFKSIGEAATAAGISHYALSNNLKKGYYWSNYLLYSFKELDPSEISEERLNKVDGSMIHGRYNSKKVYQYDKYYNLVNTYASISEAKNNLKIKSKLDYHMTKGPYVADEFILSLNILKKEMVVHKLSKQPSCYK